MSDQDERAIGDPPPEKRKRGRPRKHPLPDPNIPVRPVGRPEFVPTIQHRADIKAMSAFGIDQYDMARILGISTPTLRKHFAEELEIGLAVANARVADSLYKKAISPTGGKEAITAAIFWLRCRANWREARHEPNEQPLPQMGKKELTRALADSAGELNDWGDLLSTPPVNDTTIN